MQPERDKTKTRPKKDGEGPIEDSEISGEPKKEGETPSEKADRIKRNLEKTRKKVREREAQVEADDTEVKEKHKQEGGQ